jgi:DnaD/phage-associated family protein
MNTANIQISEADARKLLLTASPDAALLYLYIHSGNDPKGAEKELKLTPSRLSCASATLRQLGLWPDEKKEIIRSGQRPEYSEHDVLDAMDHDTGFRMLYSEVQRLLGRAMNTEELKILLSFERYLGLPAEVISVLVSYCKDKARQRGNLRNPSLRAIEKEAYYWAEQGIDTLEVAAAFIHGQNTKNTQLEHIKGLLQIRGRNLTQAEARYANGWVEMGFTDEMITMAYERTCLNTGGLSWPYMNKILTRWQEAGLMTPEQVRSGDQKKVPQGASGQLGEAELEAIQRLLREDT